MTFELTIGKFMWKTYSAKTIYRTTSIGNPKFKDKYYREDLDLIEERVVTLKARSFEEALSKGEKEALRYSNGISHINYYGQKVFQKYIGSINVFEPFDEFAPNKEVFSNTYLIKRNIPNSKITDNCMGQIFKDSYQFRINFLNAELKSQIQLRAPNRMVAPPMN